LRPAEATLIGNKYRQRQMFTHQVILRLVEIEAKA
jgi:hypothetical protein